MAELALAAFALSRINDALSLAKSLRTRISTYRKGPDALKHLSDSVANLTKNVEEVQDIIKKVNKAPENIPENDSGLPEDTIVTDSSAPEAGCVRRAFCGCLAADSRAPADIVEIDANAPLSNSFNTTFANVCATLKQVDSTMDKSFSCSFSTSERGILRKIMSCLCQFIRANELNNQMKEMQLKIDKSSNQLEHLIGRLNVVLKVDEVLEEVGDVKTTVLQEVGDVKTKLQTMQDNSLASQVTKIEYRPGTSTPALDHTITLDFNAKDEKGSPATPEAALKESVKDSPSSDNVIVAAGRMKPAIIAVGMAGVGKTVALQGLGHDEDIKKRFVDGVHYMTFGRDATLQTAIREITKIMKNTGASVKAQDVENLTSLSDAVDYAVLWFEGRNCLYLLDDLWPAESLPRGYLLRLRQLMRGSPASRMAITTRSHDIASRAGRIEDIVDFGPRKAHGSTSLLIFMAHAGRPSSARTAHTVQLPLSRSVSYILSACGGLPIALAVTGSGVLSLVRGYGGFESACDAYAEKLKNKIIWLGDEACAEGSSLNAGIMVSLECVQVEFEKLLSNQFLDYEHSIIDVYTSLCILEKQAWASVSVLSRLWELEGQVSEEVVNILHKMSLATLRRQQPTNNSPEEVGIVLHDLQLDFCRQQAAEKQKSWHDQLLRGYLETPLQPASKRPGTQISQEILRFKPRAWWSVPDDGYIHANLSRHLSCAGCELELAALLLDARWTELRGQSGGILALKTDFEMLQSFFRQSKSPRGHEATSDVERSFEQIFKAVRVSWGRHVSGWRPFQFQVCGRLLQLKQSNEVVDTFLRSVETNTQKPYLVPVSPFFPDIDGAQILEIPVGGYCSCVACSPCGRYIAAGAGADIVVADSSTGDILKRMHGHTESVTCIIFLVGSEEIVSGSQDKVIVWTWESSDTPPQVFQRHSDLVRAVALSPEGQRIISSSYDCTARTWFTTAGMKTWQRFQGTPVACVAVSAEDEKIAIGLCSGTLRVLHGVTKERLFEDTREDDSSVACVSFNPSGSYLATGSGDGTVRLWNTETWTSKLFKGHDRWVTAVAFNRDGHRIASSSRDCTVRLWDVDSGKCVGVSPRIASPMKSVTFSADGERIVSGSLDGIVRIWDARLGTDSKEKRDGHNGAVLGLAISADGLRVASASEDGAVRLWDSVTGDHVGVPLEHHGRPVLWVSFSLDGRQVASGSDDCTLRLWDTETCTQMGNPFEGNRVWCVTFSSDGFRVISGSGDGTVRIWNSETHEQIGDALRGHTAPVGCVSESADGCHVVSRDFGRKTIIFTNDSRAMIWSSENVENEIIDTEAEKIIRSCGPQTPHLWPDCSRFPEYAAELFCDEDCVYSNLLGEKTLIGNITSANCWVYHKDRKRVVVGLGSGSVAICKLITE